MDVKVLLVDDSPENLSIMCRVLEGTKNLQFDGEVVQASFCPIKPVLDQKQRFDVKETFKEIGANTPGVAIIDMRLEGDDENDNSGLHLANHIKEHFKTCSIILVSSYLPYISDFVKYLDIFQYRIDRSRPAQEFQEQLRSSFRDAVKTHLSTKKFVTVSLSESQEQEHNGIPSIYISYSRNGEEEKKAFISRLYESLCRHDYNIRIDTKDIGYTNLISEFIRQLADSECIIVVISDKYLCSPYCMIELLEIQRNHNIQRRVLPIVYEDVDIGSAGGRMGYLEYWHGQVEQVNEYIKSTGLLPLLGGQTLRDLENFRDIENSFDRLLSFILDMNFRLPSEIEESDFLLLRTRLDEECI